MTGKLHLRVKIGSITYQVKMVERLIGDDNEKLEGQISYCQQTIEIESRLTPVMQKQVLWHEVIHGILTQSGRQSEVSEGAVDAIAYGVFGVIEDNPGMREI